MDKKLFRKLKLGEKLVEMQEYQYGNTNVIKLTVYTCKRKGIFSNRVSEYTPPFFFKNKEFAEEFLKYWDEFDIEYMHDKTIYMYLEKNPRKKYCMVNEYDGIESDFPIRSSDINCGVWGGKLFFDGQSGTKFYYTNIYTIDRVPIETKNKYVFKMIKEN